ncbi:hypothetical protein B0H34DRAFT_720775 [Crassisporium funariophilum]|nr:hypothetical protein B0H34DRAFT_720775 [Crassisporium funariophilum]
MATLFSLSLGLYSSSIPYVRCGTSATYRPSSTVAAAVFLAPLLDWMRAWVVWVGGMRDAGWGFLYLCSEIVIVGIHAC